MNNIFRLAIVIYIGSTIANEVLSHGNGNSNQPAAVQCECENSTDHFSLGFQCRCQGNNLVIPGNLGENIIAIDVTNSDIKYIQKDDFKPYRSTLTDVSLSKLHSLRVIEAGSFRNMPNLRTLYITEAKQLSFVPGLFEGVNSKRFLSLRIVHTGLMEVPDLSHLHSDNILHLIDLDRNRIDRLKSNAIQVKAEQVTLNYNVITEVVDFAFNGSEIAILSLKGNHQLRQLHRHAFNGLRSLRQLDLSSTSIESMPVIGLNELEILKIEGTPSMKIIPSIYDFPHLQRAHLTHHFHCCAFRYPEEHNPQRHAQYANKLKEVCREGNPIQVDTGQTVQPFVKKRRRAVSTDDFGFWKDSYRSERVSSTYNGLAEDPLSTWSSAHHNSTHISPLRGDTIEVQTGKPSYKEEEDQGEFHNSSAVISIDNPFEALCGNFSTRKRQVTCTPEPNALNPCEDIMGSYYLRISVWFVVIFAMMGNLAVIVVVLFSGGELTVSRFLMSHLAFADFCMGLYLLLIASMDSHSVGSYFNFAFDWQYGLGCQMAGFLTMFASQLSIFTLTVVTVERWFAIAYAIYLTRRIRLGAAAKIMVAGWLYSIIIAAIPLLGVSNYSSTSICLPMDADRPIDKAYLISIMMINGLAFTLIVFCYAQIYFSLGYETRRSSTKGEMTIAKKMALLVFTDFVCWAPIAFFALTALAGYPLMGVTRSKILLVFFYPLNSCANPYLYAIMTAQYRKDFFGLLYRCGICTKKAKQYALNSSIPTTNHTHPVPLLARSSQNNIKIHHVDDAFV